MNNKQLFAKLREILYCIKQSYLVCYSFNSSPDPMSAMYYIIYQYIIYSISKLKHLNKYSFDLKRMGNWTSYEPRIEDIIEKIEQSNKFVEYQDKFSDLVPLRQLYIDETEVVIEAVTSKSYSISRLEFNWKKSNIEIELYKYLDALYEAYVHSQTISGQDAEDVSDLSDEPVLEEGISKFIKETIDTDVTEWDKWLDMYFDHESLGYKLLKAIGEDIPAECSTIGSDVPMYPPQYIWFSMLEQCGENVSVRDTIKDKVKEAYPDGTPKDILDQEGNIVVIMAQIDGKWKYIGLTTACLERIQDLYERQTY